MSDNKTTITTSEDYNMKIVEWIGQVDKMAISYDLSIPDKYIEPDMEALENRLLTGGAGSLIGDVNITKADLDKLIVDTDWDPNLEKADKIDYLVSICCGVLSGAIDSFFVGEFSLDLANDWGNEKIANFVQKIASRFPDYHGKDLEDAIRFMEEHFKIPADKVTNEMGGGKQHHLRDFSHHFSIGGLICSIFTQFSGLVIGTDTDGNLLIVPVDADTLIGKNIEEKIAFGVITWLYHMVSDMAGSSSNPGRGTGIPGPIVSLIKELSAIPALKDKMIGEHEFHIWVSKLFNGTLLAKRDEEGNILCTS